MEPPASSPPPIPSATVLVLRDAPERGVEVLLIRRHQRSGVFGGAYVFPGGKVDPEDASLVHRLDQTPAQLHDALGEPQLTPTQAGAIHVAAVRELFEEAGVLCANVDARSVRETWFPVRNRGPFAALCEAASATIASTQIAPWSRWITPVGSVMLTKRFDARFFVAALPVSQEALHDEHETTECVWVEPVSALDQYLNGQMQLAPPQVMTLSQLTRYRSVAEVLSAARARRPPCIQPEIVCEGEARVLTFPGDDRHAVRVRALPGPTRLVWRNERWEPEHGLQALLASPGDSDAG